MALVVENGAGVIGAESYASVSDIDAWWAGRTGPDAQAWMAATNADKESAAREATMFLDTQYLAGGAPYADGQGLAWPYDYTEYSLGSVQTLRRAVAMIAPLALTGPLLMQAPAEAPIISKTDKLGEISESRTYAVSENSSASVVAGRDLSFLEGLLRGLRGSNLVIGQRVLG